MMIDLAITNVNQLDDASFRTLRAGVPPPRQEVSDRYDRAVDRRTSIAVFSLLQRLWAERRSDSLPAIAVGRFGKPRFSYDAGLHFNWSHDQALCACVLAPVPVGVDISGPVPFEHSLFHYMAAPGERQLRSYLDRKNNLSALWTRKEAAIKRTGLGLTTPLRQVDTTTCEDILTFACDLLGFHISLSAEGLPADTIHNRLRLRFFTPRAPTSWEEAPHPQLRRLERDLTTWRPASTREQRGLSD